MREMVRPVVPIGFMVALALCLIQIVPLHAQCLFNDLWRGCYPDAVGNGTQLPGAAVAITYGDVVPWQAGEECPGGCYDLRAGLVVATGLRTPWDDCAAGADVGDKYQIVGIPVGTPLAFRAILEVRGTIEGEGIVVARLSDEVQRDTYSWSVHPVDSLITLGLEREAGEEFALAISLSAWGRGMSGSVRASAVLRFAGLPAGAAVVSCQNYELPVPTVGSTWGQVKARYR